MALNTKTCDTCEHFDPLLRGRRDTKWAWCAKKSVYPMVEGPGQLFPIGVKRVTEATTPARPKIVQVGQVVANCTVHQERKPKPTKQALLDELQKKLHGRPIIT